MKILFYGLRHSHIYKLVERAMKHKDLEVVGLIEDDKETREQLIKQEGYTFLDKSYEEMLKTDVDVVAIAGCYGDRGTAIIKALTAGKHVISDKPFCTSLEELDQIEKLCKEKNLKLSCMLDLRYEQSSQKAKEILESNVLGKVISVSFTGQHCLDYEKRPKWYFEKGKHGGTINDLAIHGVDLISFLSKEKITEIHYARTFNAYATKAPDFLDSAMFMGKLSSGGEVIADVSYSAVPTYYDTSMYWNFKFWCEKGLLTFCAMKDTVEVHKLDSMIVETYHTLKKKNNYLDDLINDIKNDDMNDTLFTINSARSTLLIQEASK